MVLVSSRHEWNEWNKTPHITNIAQKRDQISSSCPLAGWTWSLTGACTSLLFSPPRGVFRLMGVFVKEDRSDRFSLRSPPWQCCSSGDRPQKPRRNRRRTSDSPAGTSWTSSSSVATQSDTRIWVKNSPIETIALVDTKHLQECTPWKINGWNLKKSPNGTGTSSKSSIFFPAPSPGHWAPLRVGQSQPRRSQPRANTSQLSSAI